MAKNDQDRDLLGKMLTGGSSDMMEGLEELSTFLQSGFRPPPLKLPSARNTKGGHSRAGRKGLKKKTTHYLTREILAELDRTPQRLKKVVPEAVHRQVSKSQIVDSAIRLALRDFAEQGAASFLARHFIEKKNGS